MGRCAALVLAGGSGRRFGGEVPKQYLPVGGVPVIRRAVEAFMAHASIDRVQLVIRPEDIELYNAVFDGLALPPPVYGGDTRQDSARLGLESLVAMAPDSVLIHDGARPFVDAALIDRTLAALAGASAAVPALPVTDTLKRGDGGLVVETVSREGLWRAQTPQGFRFADILAAHRAAAGNALTDDAMVAEAIGLSIAIVAGSEDNVKITAADDMERAARALGQGGGQTRIGMGFDVHRFRDGDHVMLCGIAIPHDKGLEGHSDADAGLHALTDALLGAIGEGDIGTHFPPGEAEWQDAPSDIFLRHAGELVSSRGGVIVNLDLTVICERPKIGPHRAAMQARVAEILGIAPDAVSIKATTTERLGFTGRGEGLAAQAVAAVRL
ncbi:MAG: bifunctional 2-C-methyl-D-erythritol 4-phosphate cytidylyltransferase/2-C-methyl-D-erythritol 2,4-cyclodiphosphate synthase [Alphaproteobacteria bacterium]|nr:bifunctional 2-C-methyl-D-erythritol 4-phosphate cytidylyltransferase/2-C-methyl-D-erythritol 2,4-cyclodiphosphate synthase [Alphaproteobacteria bacterium]